MTKALRRKRIALRNLPRPSTGEESVYKYYECHVHLASLYPANLTPLSMMSEVDVEKQGSRERDPLRVQEGARAATASVGNSSTTTVNTPTNDNRPQTDDKEKEVEAGGNNPADNRRKLVTWDKDGDVDNPQTWSIWTKVRVLGVVSSGSLCVTCASSVVSSAYYGLEDELGASHEVAILGLSLFVIGLGLGPCLLAPFSEFYGRRPIYLIAFGMFFLLSFPVAFANNLPVFFIFRFLTGFAGSAFLSVAGGTVSDMWTPNESLLPMSFYTVTPFLGPVIGEWRAA